VARLKRRAALTAQSNLVMRYNTSSLTSSGGAPMLQPVPTFVISVLISLTVISFWLWMFVEMIRNDDMDSTAKGYWAVAFIFLSILAAGLYYLNIYRRRD
jgi:hypothetical protein